MLILSHPTGNQFVRNAIDAFYESNILKEFLTGYAGFSSNSIHNFLKSFIKDFSRREYPEVFKEYTIAKPTDELIRLLIQRSNYLHKINPLNSYFSIDGNFHRHDLFVASRIAKGIQNLKMVYAYEDAAFQTFKIAKEKNLIRFYDLPIGYWKAGQHWQEMAAKNQPYLRNTIRGLSESVQKIERKENELQLANHIIVASNFTKSTLIETPYYEKTIVIPYGFPQTVLAKKQHTIKKLKVLFVGGLTQRKGIGEVLDSMKSFQNQIELTIIGQLTEQTNLEFINKIKQHHWIKSLPHSEVLKVMDEHDILLFPSWFEGFGLVISEAMSRGLPVITTPNTGANEFIKNGINGWLINPGETDKIESILADLLANRSKLIEMSEAALTTAKERPWSRYKSDLANFVVQQNV